MKVNYLFKLSTRMFKARTSRTILTIFGMGVGIATILFLVSLGYGMQNVLLEKITTSDSLLSLGATPSQPEDLEITPGLISDIEEFLGVDQVSPALQASSHIRFGELTSDIETLVIEPIFLKFAGIEVKYGESFNDTQSQEIIITSAFAKTFEQDPKEMIGKEISLSLSLPKNESDKSENSESENKKIAFKDPFHIVGLIEKEEPVVYLNIENVKSSGATIDHYSEIKVKCLDQEVLEPVKKDLIAMGFSVSSLSDTVDQANKLFRIIQTILAFFGVVALFVSSIGMFNTMTVALLERTEEIGIMKSIGVSEKDILSMFVMESSIMGFLGGLFGILMGIAGGEIFNFGLNLLAQRFGGPSINLFQSPLWFAVLILVLATIVGFLTGIIPARKASSIDPLDALRYK